MKKLIDHGLDDHPTDEDDDERVPSAWAVAVLDDCPSCIDARIELTLEEVGRPGYGETAHFSPDGARRFREALRRALVEMGEPQ